MPQPSNTSILPIQNPELSDESKSPGYNWKTLTKAGLVFVTTTGAFLTLKTTESFNLIASLWKNSPSETDLDESSALANPDDPSLQTYTIPINKEQPFIAHQYIKRQPANETVVKIGPEFQVNTYTTLSQMDPSIAGLNDGKFVVTWQSDGQDGSDYGVYGQMYNTNGTKYLSEFQVNTYTILDQGGPSVVAALNDDKFVVAWMSYVQDGDNWGIYGQMFNADSSKFSSEFRVNTYTSDQRHPSVAGLSDSKFVVTWTSHDQDGENWGIYGQMFNANGTKFLSEFQVNTYTTSSQTTTSVASLSDGKFVITWQSLDQDGSVEGIYGQMFNANGTKFFSEFQVNTYTVSAQWYPSIAGLSDGKFVVTWESNGQDGSDYGSYGQIFDVNGTKFLSEFQVNTYTANNQLYPFVLGLSNGKFVVTWQSYGQDGDQNGVYGQIFKVDTAPVLVNNNLTIGKGGTATLTTNDLSATDEDDDDATLTFTVNNIQYSQFELVSNGTAITAFTQQQITDGAVQLVHDGSQNAPTYDISVSDGILSTSPVPTAITFTYQSTSEPMVSSSSIPSSLQTSSSTVSSSNQSPVLVNNTLSIEKGSTRIFGTENLSATDPNDNDMALSFTVSNVQHGQFELVSNPGVAITEFIQQQIIDGEIQFVHDDSTTAPSYWISVGDGNVSTNPAHVIVDFEAYVPLNEEFQVNTYTNYDQFVPSVASLNDGKFVVTWISSNGQDGHNYGIFGQMFNNNGTRYDTEFQVNTYTKDNQGGPSVSVLSDGKFVVVYDSNRPISNANTFGQMYNNNGTRYGGEFQINTYTQGLEFDQEVAGLSDGKFVVTWADYGDPRDGSGDGVFAQMFHNNGTRYNDEFQVNTYTNNDQVGPHATSLSDDKFVIVWHSYVQDAGSIGAYGQMYYNNGTRYGEEFQVNTYTDNDQAAFGVACLSDGKFVIVWQSWDGQDGSFHGVYGRLYNVNGTRYNDEFQVNTYTNNYQSGPSVTGLSDEKFVVTWVSYYGQDGNGAGAYAQIYNNDGTRYGSEFRVHTYTTGNQWGASITSLSDNRFAVTWDSEGQDGSGRGVYARLYARDISPILTKNTLSIKEGGIQIFTTKNLGATDPDNDNSTLIFNISNLFGGNFELEILPSNWTVTTQFTQQQITDAKIRFIDDGDEIAPSYDVSVSDGVLNTSPLPATIVFIPASKSSSLISSGKMSSSFSTIVSSPPVSSSSVSQVVSSGYQTDSVSSSKVEDSSPSSTNSIVSKLSSSLSIGSSSKKSPTFFSSSSYLSSISSEAVESSSISLSDTDSKAMSSLDLEDSSEKNSKEPTMPAWATALISTVTPGTIIALGLFAIRIYIKKRKTDGVRIEKFKEKHPITADLLETVQCSLLTPASKQFTDFVERENGLIDKLRSKEINYRSIPQREKNLIMQFTKDAIRNVTPKPNLYQIFSHKTLSSDDILVLDDQLENIANKIAANLDASRTNVTEVEPSLNNV